MAVRKNQSQRTQAKEDALRAHPHLIALGRNVPGGTYDEPKMSLMDRLKELPDPHRDVQEAAIMTIEAARLRKFVRQLPILERKVITARFGLAGEQLSTRQLATRLGISCRDIRAIERRTLEKLRGMYGLPEAA